MTLTIQSAPVFATVVRLCACNNCRLLISCCDKHEGSYWSDTSGIGTDTGQHILPSPRSLSTICDVRHTHTHTHSQQETWKVKKLGEGLGVQSSSSSGPLNKCCLCPQITCQAMLNKVKCCYSMARALGPSCSKGPNRG